MDGIIRKKVTLCGAVRSGDRILPRGCRDVEAIFDTGAPKSVLHPRVAPVAKVTIL